MQIEHRMDAKRGNLIWLSDGRTMPLKPCIRRLPPRWISASASCT